MHLYIAEQEVGIWPFGNGTLQFVKVGGHVHVGALRHAATQLLIQGARRTRCGPGCAVTGSPLSLLPPSVPRRGLPRGPIDAPGSHRIVGIRLPCARVESGARPRRLHRQCQALLRLSSILRYPAMGISRTQVNLLRLLDSAPRQENQAKLIHYVTTSRELLEQLAAETTSEGISSVSKVKLNEYSDKIEELAARLASKVPDDALNEIQEEYSSEVEHVRSPIALSSGLKRRLTAQVEARETVSEKERDVGAPIRLDADAQAQIEKHRNLQEGFTDEMVELARQLKETSLLMNQSVQETEKILDSTERVVEHSLAGTSHANARAVEVYSLTSKTTCFQWLLLFVMTCMFFMVVLLIRIT
nr:hypothetical protein SEVIR_2G164000v2 [Setaria viridis]